MKHIAYVLTFAAALAALAPAQEVQDPLQELATVIAVEEQERDLAKAEKGYRAAIAGGKLSTEGRLVAHMRLAKLLRKLGREKEADALMEVLMRETPAAKLDDVTQQAPAQDLEREKALREKAKGLVQQVLDDPNPSVDESSKLFGVRASVAEQLLWIGQPAVPVVIAALEDLAKSETYSPNVIAGLAGFLWRTGGPQAAEFLKTCAKQGKPAMRGNVVRTAYQANRPEMLATVEVFLDDPDQDIVRALLSNADQNAQALEFRLEYGVLLGMAERGGPERKAYILSLVPRRVVGDPATARRIVQLVRQGFLSTDPAVGAAARKCLESSAVQSCVEGIELLHGEVPKLRDVRFPQNGAPDDAGTRTNKNTAVVVSPEVGKRLWPQVVACIRTLDEDHPQRAWVQSVANWVLPAVGPDAVPELLGLVDAGIAQSLGLQGWLAGLVTSENAVAVLSRYERLGGWGSRQRFLNNLRADLPPVALPVLREKAELQRRETPEVSLGAFARPMVRTGLPEVADWIIAEFRRLPAEADWPVPALLALGRRTQDEKVRVAMRTLLEDGPGTNSKDLLLALLSMHDLPTLESEVLMVYVRVNLSHPYGPKGNNVCVADYLFGADPKPPHGFTEDELAGLLGRLAATKRIENAFSWQDVGKLTPRLHGEVVRLQLQVLPPDPDHQNGLPGMLVQTVLHRAETPEGQGSLRDWATDLLRDGAPHLRQVVLTELERTGAAKQALAPQQALVESFLDGDDGKLAVTAARALAAAGLTVDPARLAKNRHAGVRRAAIARVAATTDPAGETTLLPLLRDPDATVRTAAAEFYGARVSKQAVPELIALLRDPAEPVRKAAADALTRIRFFHEQQAHWDRVLKGLDATPASAAEKLLLQAKPGAPKAQRLLAITSLGTLGVPEALPFLIEWTADPDAELAAASKAAITQIHLNPRK